MTRKNVAPEKEKNSVLGFDGRGLNPVKVSPVREAAVTLKVNGVELATLTISPHDPKYLVAGFLRTQGLVGDIDDILTLGVCEDLTVAHVNITGSVPENLKPTLTSGCGTGITFTIPGPPVAGDAASRGGAETFRPEDIFFMMEQLVRRAESYRQHGGIHSAAAGDGRSVLLFAEDIGRHNTLDRIAGEALLKRIDLTGKMLVTSGRVSSDMAAKSAALGISLIASRTSPTDMAVRLCRDSGITLVGYVRGRRFNVYARPEGVSAPPG